MIRLSEIIVFGGGCFWCTEAVFSMFNGVQKVTPGYAGGQTKNPTYDEVCNGDTGHAEVLRVEYDPKVAPLEKLLEIFFKMHDPTTKDRQGADVGSQYRSIILYTKEEQKTAINEFIGNLQVEFDNKILTEVKRLDAFYPAEGYHKDYFKRNPLQPYCAFVIRPKVNKIKKEFQLK
ncbi:MAG: peptide-methionine (S)-S-oxide reductase MsrA [Candidatus Micrarchaeota archaeon]|nr:peptide-methionine (S)-S-oxide reductase MsrA [Candidatus Micrarchaeota archaeon]